MNKSIRICPICQKEFQFKNHIYNQIYCSRGCAAKREFPINDPIVRFWSKVDIKGPNDCWEWQAATTTNKKKKNTNYGTFWFKGKQVPAHRFSYELEFGPIPENHQACHKCDNPPCVNPHHLFSGTNSENVQDKIAKGRQPHGEISSVPKKLTPEKVIEIRNLYGSGQLNMHELGLLYSINFSTVSKIIRKKRWAWVE